MVARPVDGYATVFAEILFVTYSGTKVIFSLVSYKSSESLSFHILNSSNLYPSLFNIVCFISVLVSAFLAIQWIDSY